MALPIKSAVNSTQSYGGSADGTRENPPSNNLWIGNVSPDVSETELKAIFEKYGQVDSAATYSSRNYAFVQFKEVEEARSAKQGLQGLVLHGNSLKIEFAKPPFWTVCKQILTSTKAKPCKSLWVAGISQSVSKEELENEFLKFGKIQEFRFLRDRNTAFIDYVGLEDATRALRSMNGKRIGGAQIRVDYLRSHTSKREQGENYFPGRNMGPSDFRWMGHDTLINYPEPGLSGSKRKNYGDAPLSKILWIRYPPSVIIVEDMIHNALILFGEIERIKTFSEKNYAFVEFRSIEEARRAKEGLQGKLFNDPRILIEYFNSEFPGGREQVSEYPIYPLQMDILGINSPVFLGNNLGHQPSLGIPGPDVYLRPPLGPHSHFEAPGHGQESMDLAAVQKLQEPSPRNLMGGPSWNRLSPSPGIVSSPSTAFNASNRSSSGAWDVFYANQRESKRSRFEAGLPLEGPEYDEQYGLHLIRSGGASGSLPRGTTVGFGQRNAERDCIWRGLIAKGGTPVCRARCVPVGEGFAYDMPEARTQILTFLLGMPASLILAYQSLGVVYGDLSTSPLYVYHSIFIGKLQNHQNPDTVFGAFSLIFWTLTLIPLLKYVIIILTADDNGEGGTFALYSLLCRHGKFSLLPNQQAADEELSAYKYGPLGHSSSSLALKRYLEKRKNLRTALLLVVLLGAGMVIGDGVVTPAMSVISSVSGLEAAHKRLPEGGVRLISCIILVGLFALQHSGTHKVGFLFAPVVVLWLISIFAIGLYNTIKWNPKILSALSPLYIIKFFRETGKDGWISLGGVLLSITGTEAMFADLGHFSATSIRIVFVFLVYPCLVMQYMGQAAFLSKNISAISNSFYDSIPGGVFWPVFVLATFASIVASQAIISATFSIIKQCHALGCFPRVKVVHTSKQIQGQIYIPEINWILMILTLAVAIGFRDVTSIGNAYGLAVMSVMFITTFLMALVIVFVWQRNIILSAVFLLFFWLIEAVYLSAAFIKVPQGGWVSLVLSLFFMFIMFVWHYGTRKKYNFDLHNKVPLKWILGLGPSLGIVRVPGIGLIYSELATGVPAIFSHFVTNLPAFHNVLVFVCVKYVPVPFVSPEERFLIGRICPRPYRMYRCIVRYGYKDLQGDDGNFENQLIQSIAEFIQMEAVEPQSSALDSMSYDGRMAVISSRTFESGSSLIASEVEEIGSSNSIQSSKSLTLRSLRSGYDDENPQIRRRQVRFQVPQSLGMDVGVREELLELVEAKEAGVAYIMGHSYVKARRSSSFLKKVMIDFGYSFLRKNCRGPSVALHIPHISLIEVGMIYHV